ncbi:MAG: 2Fe-2S iron-sulfur cluster-binding protein [Bacillota bacterium]
MPWMTINGTQVQFRDGETVLAAARSGGIEIPSLCFRPGLGHHGSCRLCLVEILAGGRPGLAASCTLPAAEGLVVEAGSERVIQSRRMVLGLLLARSPDAKPLRELSEKLGAQEFPPRPDARGCVLCGLCVRACRAVGQNAINFSGRGRSRRVTVPFDLPPGDCLGCRACENVCPAGVIKVVESRGRITILPWQSELDTVCCSKCGASMGSRPQWESLEKIFTPSSPRTGLCPACRRRFQAAFHG